LTSEHGAREGLGVLIAWPAILAALALISVPFNLGFPGHPWLDHRLGRTRVRRR
jgi:hypothetical protein